MFVQVAAAIKKQFFCLIFVALFGAPLLATAMPIQFGNQESETKLQVGDLIEFDFLGKTYQAEITKFTGTGWPYVEFEYNGKTIERFFPDSRVTLVQAAEDEESNDEPAMGQTGMRTWTDETGAFEMKAKLLSNNNGKVELEKEDGRVVTLPAIKLSQADQDFLKEVEKAVADDKNPENPFAGGVMKKAKPAGRAERRDNNRVGRRKTETQPVLDAIEPEYDTNSLVLSSNGWKFKPDPAVPPPAELANSNRVIRYSTGLKEHEFHNQLSGVSISPDKSWAGASVSNVFDNFSEIVAIDLANEKVNGPFSIPLKEAKLIAISPDGKQAVTVSENRGREPGGLNFWSLAGNKAKVTQAWNTAGFGNRNGFLPKSGLFIDKDRLLTFGRRVVLWDCETAAAIYSFPISDRITPAISPNANQIAVASGEQVYIVDVKDGSVLGAIDSDSSIRNLAFSNSGQFLAGLNSISGEVWVWDLAAQQKVREFSAPASSFSNLQWVGDQYLLVDSKYLMDVELRATVWKYEPVGKIISGRDGRFWLSAKSRLTPVKLPHKNLDPLTAKFVPDDLLILKPGTEVAIELDLPFPPAQQKTIRDRLVGSLEKVNVVINDDAELKLIASIKKGKKNSIEVSNFHDPFGRRGPVKRLCQPNPGFFSSVVFPKHIAQLPSGKPLGVSKITERGIQ